MVRAGWTAAAPVTSRGTMAGVWVIVVAAGSGRRFGAAKQYEPLAGRRVLDWSLDAARTVADGVVLVVAEAYAGAAEPGADAVVAGAATRSGSVRAGLAAVPASAEVVVVHDAARPLAGAALFAAVVDGGAGRRRRRAAGRARERHAPRPTTAPPSTGTGSWRCRRRRRSGPDALRGAHGADAEATDDASLVEAEGGKVVVVPGSPDNLKITRPTDLVVAEALLRAR